MHRIIAPKTLFSDMFVLPRIPILHLLLNLTKFMKKVTLMSNNDLFKHFKNISNIQRKVINISNALFDDKNDMQYPYGHKDSLNPSVILEMFIRKI